MTVTAPAPDALHSVRDELEALLVLVTAAEGLPTGVARNLLQQIANLERAIDDQELALVEADEGALELERAVRAIVEDPGTVYGDGFTADRWRDLARLANAAKVA